MPVLYPIVLLCAHVSVSLIILSVADAAPQRHASCHCDTWKCLGQLQRSRHQFKDGYKFPHFYSGGMQKCGTTTLSVWLKEHPQVVMSDPKEPEYFFHEKDQRGKEASVYLNRVLHFPAVCKANFSIAAGEATAGYLTGGVKVARAIYFTTPWLRIVIILREPIARAMSWLQHNYVKYRKGCLTHSSMADCVRQDWFMKDSSYLNAQYGANTKAWLSVFPRNNILFLALDEMSIHPERVYNRTLDFLWLKPYRLAAYENHKKRSTKPYNIPEALYQRMVTLVKPDVKLLNQVIGGTAAFGAAWGARWQANLVNCPHRICSISLDA